MGSGSLGSATSMIYTARLGIALSRPGHLIPGYSIPVYTPAGRHPTVTVEANTDTLTVEANPAGCSLTANPAGASLVSNPATVTVRPNRSGASVV
jgi:hypothetical protein